MRRASFFSGLALVPLGWLLAAGPLGMTGHMAGHMVAVALAAPLVAWGLDGTSADPASRWPHILSPLATMLLELCVVWGWHLPMLRRAAHDSVLVLACEQASFLIAGLLLWSTVLHAPRRAAGIGVLLLTSMHMTLLGVLIGLAPRPLYPDMHHAVLHELDPLADQQLGAVIMLLVGAASYFLGGLLLLAGLLRRESGAPA